MPVFDVRKKEFKKGLSTDDCRRKRGDSYNIIRKVKRNEGLAKRRMMSNDDDDTAGGDALQSVSSSASAIEPQVSSLPHIKEILNQYGTTVSAENKDRLFEAIRAVRKMLSIAQNPPVEEVLNANIMEQLVAYLECFSYPRLQFEAAWALTNVASTDYTEKVVESGAIPKLVPLLMAGTPELREQAAWCLSNIAGDRVEYRDMILDTGAISGLIANIKDPANIEMLRNTMWTVSNLCRGKPQPEHRHVGVLLPVFKQLLDSCEDLDTLSDLCWSLAYLSDGPDERIQYIIDAKLAPAIVKVGKVFLETTGGSKMIAPVVRALGNLLTGSDEQTQAVIDAGFLNLLPSFIAHPKSVICKEACWAASNITAGTSNQITSLLATKDLLEGIMHALENHSLDIKKEAQWTIANICTNGTNEHVQYLVQRYEVIEPLVELLEVDDVSVIKLSLDALDAILKLDPEKYGMVVDECDGIDRIDELQRHANEDVFQKATALIDNYFQLESDEEEDALKSIEGSEAFTFGDENSAPGYFGEVKQFDFGTSTTSSPITQRQLNFGGALQESSVGL